MCTVQLKWKWMRNKRSCVWDDNIKMYLTQIRCLWTALHRIKLIKYRECDDDDDDNNNNNNNNNNLSGSIQAGRSVTGNSASANCSVSTVRYSRTVSPTEVTLALYTPWRHSGSGVTAPRILNLGSECSPARSDHFTRKKSVSGTHWVREWVGPCAGLGALEKERNLATAQNQTTILGLAASSSVAKYSV